MATDVVMPKLSDTMEDGKILRWLKNPGDRVARGDVLAEVETDKADMELEAESEGVLSEIVVEEGGSAAVGQVIARLGDSAKAAAPREGRKEEAEKPEETGEARAEDEEEGGAVGAEDEEEERPATAPRRAPGPRRADGGDGAGRASPEVRKLAREQGIDLSKIPGSGPGGRVVRRDLERGASAAAAAAKRPSPTTPPLAAKGREALSRIRRTVARRMAESKREAPLFFLTAEIDMGECVRVKEGLGAARPDEPLSYTHLLLRAVALALREHPRINARYAAEDAIEFSDGIHLGIAVALEEGLIVPVLHHCESKDLFEIAFEARALVERVRGGKPHGEDLSGGTFTVSNLGMYPIEDFAAVINPPQAAVLAVGALRERPVVRNGAIVPATTMRVTLSSDHRVIDGAEAARFLETLKGILETPLRIVL
ncbi:MAG: dihydrolipoamide acetyltransferase family protein [Candidatus Binatia bacterium]